MFVLEEPVHIQFVSSENKYPTYRSLQKHYIHLYDRHNWKTVISHLRIIIYCKTIFSSFWAIAHNDPAKQWTFVFSDNILCVYLWVVHIIQFFWVCVLYIRLRNAFVILIAFNFNVYATFNAFQHFKINFNKKK